MRQFLLKQGRHSIPQRWISGQFANFRRMHAQNAGIEIRNHFKQLRRARRRDALDFPRTKKNHTFWSKMPEAFLEQPWLQPQAVLTVRFAERPKIMHWSQI